MKRWLRRYLGIVEIQEDQAFLSRKLDEILSKGTVLQASINAITPGLGRIIAKLDPIYGTSEDDPARRKASNDLGEAAINRLMAEDLARRHMTGEP